METQSYTIINSGEDDRIITTMLTENEAALLNRVFTALNDNDVSYAPKIFIMKN